MTREMLSRKIVDRMKRSKLDYGDVRIIDSRRQDLQLKNGKISAHTDVETEGYGIRLLVDGFWGFSSHHELDETAIDRTIAEAYSLADLAATAARRDPKKATRLVPAKPVTATWKSPCARDPFAVALAEKIDRLRHWDERLRRVKGVTVAASSLSFRHERKLFCSTEGSLIDQETTVSGVGYYALATDGSDAQIRSYPNSFGQYSQKGYELLDDWDLDGETERVGEEAVALLKAPQCPAGRFDIILDGSQLGLQVHESCGHPIELDRVLGWEANYAGRSFLTLDKLGKFQYGSPIVNITADSTSVGGMGTFAYDDEGSPATSWKIVDGGRFVGYLTSRETAPIIGEKTSRACVRADGWNRMPMIRMVNVSLDPGTWKLDDLFADTEGGLYLETNRSWSIDQLRYNFQFGVEAAWEIRGGKKGQLYKNATYQGITPEFWSRCDAICDSDHWLLWGVPNCGKGEPGQIMGTGHGAAPARFRGVEIGMGYSKS